MRASRWMTAAVVIALGCAARREGLRLTREGVELRTRQPSATSVAVAGDFNGWSTSSHPMTRAGDVWTARVKLPPGEYLFMYVIDGRSWVTPAPAMELVPDGFGGWNGRLVVP